MHAAAVYISWHSLEDAFDSKSPKINYPLNLINLCTDTPSNAYKLYVYTISLKRKYFTIKYVGNQIAHLECKRAGPLPYLLGKVISAGIEYLTPRSQDEQANYQLILACNKVVE